MPGKLIKAILSAALILFLLTIACGEKIDPVGSGDFINPEKVTYTNDMAEIFPDNCLRCHSTNIQGAERNGAPVDVNFNTYELAKDNATRANARVQAGTMPPDSGPLSDSLKAIFQQWIDDGLEE